VIVFSIVSKFRALAGVATGLASLVSANPAFANASANADILAPLRAAQTAKHQAGDEEFRQLFSNWQSMDRPATRQNPARQNLVSIAMPGRSTGSFSSGAPGFAQQKVSIPSLVPVDGVRLTSDFGMRWHPVLGGRRQHKGIDLAAPVGTPIHAAADGMVSRADWFSSYGLYVAVEHGGEIETRYGHMSRLNVAAGQMVHKGDIIGYVGTTGRSTGPHLHYEVRVAGEAVNPVPYLQSGAAGGSAVGTVSQVAMGSEQD
jgi:murein DD-endopeptidase MepM/ murein hydrolase activator NlpD